MLFFAPTSFAQNEPTAEEAELIERERAKRLEELLRTQEAERQKALEDPLTEAEIEEQKLVEVEQTYILPSDLSNVSALVPYKYRRERWGNTFSVTYAMIEPINYESAYASGGLINYEALYGDSSGMIEVSYSHKYNFFLGAISGELGIGFWSDDVDDNSFGNIDLALQQYRFGARYTADNLFAEPLIAPYAGAGVYSMGYREELAGDTTNGITDPALYVYVGALFQLDWIDRSAALEAFIEGGIQNTFVFVEGRKYFASSTAQDPDFSTDFNLSGGVTVEF